MSLSPKQIEERLEQLIQVCRTSGVRMTRQRSEVFHEVARTEAHPDAETVFRRIRERMPRISLDTVYRTLSSLESMGLITRLSALRGAARFDANTHRHHHFVCTTCGLVRDFQCPELDGFMPPTGVANWGNVDSVHAELRGMCSECLSGKANRGLRSPSADST